MTDRPLPLIRITVTEADGITINGYTALLGYGSNVRFADVQFSPTKLPTADAITIDGAPCLFPTELWVHGELIAKVNGALLDYNPPDQRPRQP